MNPDELAINYLCDATESEVVASPFDDGGELEGLSLCDEGFIESYELDDYDVDEY